LQGGWLAIAAISLSKFLAAATSWRWRKQTPRRAAGSPGQAQQHLRHAQNPQGFEQDPERRRRRPPPAARHCQRVRRLPRRLAGEIRATASLLFTPSLLLFSKCTSSSTLQLCDSGKWANCQCRSRGGCQARARFPAPSTHILVAAATPRSSSAGDSPAAGPRWTGPVQQTGFQTEANPSHTKV